MRGIKKLGSASGLFLLVALVAGSPRPATARGFCNVDGIGSKELQQEVGSAAAMFFEGGSYLMTMLSDFERGNSKGKEVGLDAEKAFSSARDLYRSVKMPETVDKKLATVKLETAAAIAQTSPSAPLFLDIATKARGLNASVALMTTCSEESDRMRGATAEFLEAEHDQEKHTAALLATWARVLFTGRTVSAFFAAAGGEK